VQTQQPVLAAAGLVLLWAGVGVTLALRFSGRIQDWSVMTDELLYAKLATAIAGTGSPLPEIHGASISVLNQLYPLLLAPFYGALSPPSAFRAAHVLNAVVMASAVFPAYLLARQVLSRPWSFAVSVLSVLVPWMIVSGFLMTEVAAYPAFLWAILGLQLAIATPSPRRDLLAVGALGLAVLARTQLVALVLVLPLAIVGHELGKTLTAPVSTPSWRKSLAGPREAVRQHAVLAVLYALGAAVAAIATFADSAGSLLGVYSPTVEEGSILPAGVWSAAARHIDAVGIGCGLAPLLLGGGWMLAATVRPRSPREHALATLSLATVVALTLEAASFGVRFGGTEVVRDRYLFYVVPLLLIGAVAALVELPRRQAAIGAALIAVFFAATAPLLEFRTFAGVWVDSPASVLNDLLIEQSGALGTGTFVALIGLFLGAVLALGVLLAPRPPLALLVLAALLVFSILTLRSEVDRVVSGTGLSGRPLAGSPGTVLNWVDSVLPDGAQAAIMPFPVSSAWDTTAIRWWDVEFWNRSVTETYVAQDGNFTYTPYRSRTLEIDWATGQVADTSDAPPYVVAAPGDSRFLLAGSQHAANVGLVVRAVERPYHAVWASRGLQTDGWTSPGSPATIRVYGHGQDRPELMDVQVSVRAPSTAPARYRISAPAVSRMGALPAGGSGAETLSLCVPAGSEVDMTLSSSTRATIEGPPLSPELRPPRLVGIALDAVSIEPTGREC
jgi:hypothetical protein